MSGLVYLGFNGYTGLIDIIVAKAIQFQGLPVLVNQYLW